MLVLISSSDQYVSAIADHADALADHFVLSPAARLQGLLATKQTQYDLAARHGMPMPRTSFVDSQDEVEAFAALAEFPSLIKPIHFREWQAFPQGHRLSHTKVAVSGNRAELVDNWRLAAAVNPHVIVQEIIQGPDTAKRVYLSCYDGRSRRIANALFRELRCDPVGFGPATISEPVVDTETDVVCDRFLRSIGYAGICGQEHAYYVLLESSGGDPERDQARFEEALGEAIEAGLVADAVIASSEGQREALWALRDAVEMLFRIGMPVGFDVSLPVSEMEGYVSGVLGRLASEWPEYQRFVFGHLGDGNLHIIAAGPPSRAARHGIERCVYEPLAARGGSVSAEHGTGLEKQPWLALSRSAAELHLMRRIKWSVAQSNQEANRLLPRRIVSWRSGPVETIPISQPTSSARWSM